MSNLLKNNRNLVISLVVGLIVLVVAGSLMLLTGKKSEPIVEEVFQEEQISMMKPEDIGLSLRATSGNRKLILEIENTEGISGVDYELSYISKGDIPRGVIGYIDIKMDSEPVTQEITLGTCSDVCHYDEDISDIKLILKVAKVDGSTAQIEEFLEL
jgi:hypothetical protein